eukprot:gene13944-42880_t
MDGRRSAAEVVSLARRGGGGATTSGDVVPPVALCCEWLSAAPPAADLYTHASYARLPGGGAHGGPPDPHGTHDVARCLIGIVDGLREPLIAPRAANQFLLTLSIRDLAGDPSPWTRVLFKHAAREGDATAGTCHSRFLLDALPGTGGYISSSHSSPQQHPRPSHRDGTTGPRAGRAGRWPRPPRLSGGGSSSCSAPPPLSPSHTPQAAQRGMVEHEQRHGCRA